MLAAAGASMVWVAVWPGWESLPLHPSVAALMLCSCAAGWGLWHRRCARRRLTGLSHDLLTAMTIIRGHVELLGRRPASVAEIEGVREVVVDEIDRMTDRLDGGGRGRRR